MAEREGFEPSVELLTLHSLSRRAPSASRSSLRNQRHQQKNGGGSRIRTHGTFVQRFSRPPPSTTRPFLHFIWTVIYHFEIFMSMLDVLSRTLKGIFSWDFYRFSIKGWLSREIFPAGFYKPAIAARASFNFSTGKTVSPGNFSCGAFALGKRKSTRY